MSVGNNVWVQVTISVSHLCLITSVVGRIEKKETEKRTNPIIVPIPHNSARTFPDNRKYRMEKKYIQVSSFLLPSTEMVLIVL